ncbi:excalibur calcium-binding domain-containing protein [Saccharothrix saharensis]|uniref:excalibur calcium-binding domain-containing protein n=1 Tax=Saccharothrix saharensis TaxID=571190 RepID=UPI00368369A6
MVADAGRFDGEDSTSSRVERNCDMLLSRFVGAAVLTASATLPIVGVAYAQDDRDCADFGSQAEAQRFFDSADANHHRLDADNDGIACEGLPAPSHIPTTRRTRVPEPPVGGIDAGDGSAAADSTAADPGALPLLVGLAGIGAVSATAVAARRARRSR